MTNSEFDKKLSDIVSEETIPFNEDNWGHMQQMLDGKSNNRRLLIAIPFLAKPYAAAAAVIVAIATAWYLYPQQEEIITVKNNNHTIQQIIERTTTPSKTETPSYTPTLPHTPVAKQEMTAQSTQPANRNHVIVNPSSDIIAPAEEKTVFNFQQPIDKKSRNTIIPQYDIYEERKLKTTSFGLHTGMAVYRNRNSFAAGITMQNRLNSKLSIQTGLGYVHGKQDISIKHITVTETEVITPTDTSYTTHIEKTITERYEQQSRNLPYIQVNPGVSVQVFRKLYAVAGADVQRVVADKKTINEINHHLADAGKKVPETDFGGTLSMNYMVTKNIGMGVTYRQSLLHKSNDGKEYIKRNYFLVQLQYAFNRR